VEAEHIIPSSLAGDIRDGRVGVPVNRDTERLLVKIANLIVAHFRPIASIYWTWGDVWTTTIEAAATMIPGMLCSDQHSEKLLTLAKSSAWGPVCKLPFQRTSRFWKCSVWEKRASN
jgi:hypothetical protein